MAITFTNLYVATQLMQLKSSTGLQSFITTVWDGNTIMIVWNELNGTIMQIWDEANVEEEDMPKLYNLVRVFIKYMEK